MTRLLLAALACALLVAPFVLSSFWVHIAVKVLAFALYASSFNLLLGYGGMLSFGHAAYFAMGGYACALLIARADAPILLALAAAPLLSAALAGAIGYFCVRRSGIYFAMLTFAFQMLLYTIALKAIGLTNGDDGVTGVRPSGLLSDAVDYYYFTLAIVATALVLLYRLVNSPFGFTLRALRNNPRRVEYVGVPVRLHQWVTFVVAGGFAGLAGGLYALSIGSVFPNWLNWTESATPVVMAVLGGLHTFAGPIVGAAVYVVLETVISGQTEYWHIFMGAIILFLILVLPEGLTGTPRLRRRMLALIGR
ncbi:MAG: branched-chain amino acid ABC transporter permease [Sneathiellaceae bacterium]